MSDPTRAREALIVEALGDTATLIRQVEALAPRLEETREALLQANSELRESLAGFEGRMAAVTENVKTKTTHYLAARVEEAARRSTQQQSQAMADAARVAFGAEVGAAMQRLQAALQPLAERRRPKWELWLTHLAAAAVASAATWIFAMRAGGG